MDKAITNGLINFKLIENGSSNKMLVEYDNKLALDIGVICSFIEQEEKHDFQYLSVDAENDELIVHATYDSFEMECKIIPEVGESNFLKFSYDITNKSDKKRTGRFSISFDIKDTGIPRWMVPGMFYKENRPKNCKRLYPRYDFNGGDPEKLVSDHWSFRSDRSTMPGVFCWTDSFTSAVTTDEMFSHGASGLHFKGNREGTQIGLNFPFCEEPVPYMGWARDSFNPDRRTIDILPHDKVSFSFRLYISDPDLHSYNTPIRELYYKNLDKNPLNPWMNIKEACELAAYGLYKWHYKDEYHILYETIGFDNIVSGEAGMKDCRPHMHISWVSGAPYAYALLKYGRRKGIKEYVDAGINVIDKITEGMAPAGILWSQWTVEKGWDSGWNPQPNWSQARTVGEAVLFMLKAYRFEKENGILHDNWESIINKNLSFVLERQRNDGNYGSYYNAVTGEVTEWDGCGGVIWICAFTEAYILFGDERFKNSSTKAGEYYKEFIYDEFVYGAPEDVHLTPTSEDGYNYVMAYIALYEIDNNKEWLEIAKRSADWMLTYRFGYNVTFSKKTLLGAYDYRTRGGDIASPSNNHIHNYGLVCLPDMMKLYQYTKDEYYLKRTGDNLACFMQFIARQDGDFSAGKGMVTEHWYYTDWIRPKGSILGLSHAWCIGMILYAGLEIMEKGLQIY